MKNWQPQIAEKFSGKIFKDDKFILSKAHAAIALYAVLADLDYFIGDSLLQK